MQNCLIYVGGGDSKNPILGMVNGDPAAVKGALQQYQKAFGPVINRAAFNDFAFRNKAIMQIVGVTPIDSTQY